MGYNPPPNPPPAGANQTFVKGDLLAIVNNATATAKARLLEIKNSGSAISIADMFDMQMVMNQLSQLSEMSSAIVTAANSCILDMAKAAGR